MRKLKEWIKGMEELIEKRDRRGRKDESKRWWESCG